MGAAVGAFEASPRWPADGERFERDWEQLKIVSPLFRLLSEGEAAAGDPERVDSVLSDVLDDLCRETDSAVLALLTPNLAGGDVGSRPAPVVLRAVAVPPGQPPPTFSAITVPFGQEVLPFVVGTVRGSIWAQAAIEVPLNHPVAGEVGWLVALCGRDTADSERWATNAIAVFEQVAWALTLLLRNGWQTWARASQEQLRWPDLAEHELSRCRAASHVHPPQAQTIDGGAEYGEPAAHKLVDENVQFTVYRPRAMAAEVWTTILAFAHLAARRPDAAADVPDPVEEVRRQAQQVLGDRASAYGEATEDSAEAIPRKGEITFVLDLPGLQVNPRQRSFLWLEDVHREEFHVRAPTEQAGQTVRGSLRVYCGALVVAEVTLAIRVDQAGEAQHTDDLESAHARPYRRIFPSYSRLDAPIVEQVETYAGTLGDQYLRDVTQLRAGEVWSDRLAELIREADVFQLFWSRNSMGSQWVRHEWEYALSLNRPHFVRPTYWETPMPEAPDRDLPPAALRVLHFHRLPIRIERAKARADDPSTIPQERQRRSRASRQRLLPSAMAALLLVGLVGTLLTWRMGARPRDVAKPAAPTLQALSPDGTLVAKMEPDGRIEIRQRTSSALALTITPKVSRDQIVSLRFSPDGTRLVCETRDGGTIEWDIRTGSRVANLDEFSPRVRTGGDTEGGLTEGGLTPPAHTSTA